MVVVNTQTGASPRWNRNRCSSASVRPPKIRATGTPRASSASAIGAAAVDTISAAITT